MLLSIIIPTYNSRGRVIEVIKKINKVNFKPLNVEVIVVDDASIDRSTSKLKSKNNLMIIRHKKNQGKGGAVKTGLTKANGDIFFIQDDDMEYDPFDIPKILKPILNKKYEVVYGSRRLNKKNTYSSMLYYIGGVVIDTTIKIILTKNITDAITGSKAFTKNVYNAIKPLETKGFEIEAEITAKIIKKGFKIHEVPITYSPRTHQEGKNIRWHHAFPLFKALIIYQYFR